MINDIQYKQNTEEKYRKNEKNCRIAIVFESATSINTIINNNNNNNSTLKPVCNGESGGQNN